MSTVDPTQVEKIVSLLKGSSEYQTQALELLLALSNPDLTKAVRANIQPTITLCEPHSPSARTYLNMTSRNMRIQIDDSRLQEFISSGVFQTIDVKKAFCTDIDIEDLEELIQSYPHLEVLKIKSSSNYFWYHNSNTIVQLPDSIGSLTKLKNLYIENLWGLAVLPETMSNLTKLEKVSFARTGLTALPSWLIDCPNLTVLNINGMDKLKAIHPTLMNHPSLKRIHAYQNSRNGTVNPALPNTNVTIEKYEGSIVYWGTSYPMQERLSKHESKWRQQAYLRQRWNG